MSRGSRLSGAGRKVPPVLAGARRAYAAGVVLCGIAEAAAAGVAAFAMRDVFAALHSGAAVPLMALGILALCAGAVAMARVASHAVSERLGQRYAIELRRRLYRHLAGESVSTLAARRSGALALRFVGDLTAVRDWAGGGLAHAIAAAIVMPSVILTLWLIDTELAAAAIGPLALLCVVMLVGGALLSPVHRSLRARRARIATSMMERARVAPHLDRMRRTGTEVAALDRDGEVLSGLAVRRMRRLAALRAAPEIGLALTGVALVAAAFAHGKPAAELAASLAILSILITPLRDLADVWDQYTAWRVARGMIESVLRRPSKRRDPFRSTGGVAVRFEAVRFRGVAGAFAIAAGETVIVRGRAGSGKSTLLRLAAGLERPDAGVVRFLQGEREVSPRALVVAFDAPILQGSLRRALCLGALKRPKDAKVREVARAFGLGGLMRRLGGLSGRLGEDGRTISEGEAIRIHLARAVLTRPNVVVIDTPLIDVDPALQRLVARLRNECHATFLIATMRGRIFAEGARWLMVRPDGVEEGEPPTPRATPGVQPLRLVGP